MMMTAGFVLTLAGWFAPPITDTVLRVRMAGPITLFLGFLLLLFSYILCAVEQDKCSECCYQYIRAREKEHDIRSCDPHLMTSSNSGLNIDPVITQNHLAPGGFQHLGPGGPLQQQQQQQQQQQPSLPDQIQLLQQHLQRLQQEALLHPGLNYVYNPLIAAYGLHPHQGADLQGSQDDHHQMESLMSRNSHIPFIDDPSSDTSVQLDFDTNGSLSGSNNSSSTIQFPVQKGHVVRLPKHKMAAKSKNGRSKCSLKDMHYTDVIANSNAEEDAFLKQREGIGVGPQHKRQPKKELLNRLPQRNLPPDGSSALHFTDHSAVRDAIGQPLHLTHAQWQDVMTSRRVTTSETLSLCVPVTPDSDGDLTDKLEVLSTNSSFTSQLSPQTHGTSLGTNGKGDPLGHVIANRATSPEWEDSTGTPSPGNPAALKSQHDTDPGLGAPGLQTPNKDTATGVAMETLRTRMSLDLVPDLKRTSNPQHKPITSVKPLPKDLGPPLQGPALQGPAHQGPAHQGPAHQGHALHALPIKPRISPKLPIARILHKSDEARGDMLDSAV